jgi:hypothetical protein
MAHSNSGIQRLRNLQWQNLVLLNLYSTSSYFHNDVTQFLYDGNEFYFSYPDSLEHFLLCILAGPFNVNPGRHFGIVILDLCRCISFPPKGHPWPVIPLDTTNRNCTTTDWDGHYGRLPSFTSTYLLRRHVHTEGKKKARAGKKEVERQAGAARRVLEQVTYR